MKKLVLVGNSPDVINHKVGPMVDAFDVVIRMNNFVTQGYETFVGSKTSYVFMTFATCFSPELYAFQRQNIYLFVAEKSRDFSFLSNRMKREGASAISPHEVNILSEEYYAGLNNKIGLKGKQRASIGLIAIEWVMRHFSSYKLHTHGIDFFKGQTNTLHHYFEHITPADDYHDFGKENRYFSQYLSKHFTKLKEIYE